MHQDMSERKVRALLRANTLILEDMKRKPWAIRDPSCAGFLLVFTPHILHNHHDS